MRDTVLAGCVVVLFFSLQSPELVDRWLWLPFMLALCFRDALPASGPDTVPLVDDELVPALPAQPPSDSIASDRSHEAVGAPAPTSSAPTSSAPTSSAPPASAPPPSAPPPSVPPAQRPSQRRVTGTVRRNPTASPPFQPDTGPPPAS
jgi:hypothetical protein